MNGYNYTLRGVRVQITEPHFAGDPKDAEPLDPPNPFGVGFDEQVVAVTPFQTTSGTMGSMITQHAHVWIMRRSRD